MKLYNTTGMAEGSVDVPGFGTFNFKDGTMEVPDTIAAALKDSPAWTGIKPKSKGGK